MRHHNYTLYLAFSLSHVQVLEVLSDWSYGVHSLRLHTVASRHIDISNCATCVICGCCSAPSLILPYTPCLAEQQAAGKCVIY